AGTDLSQITGNAEDSALLIATRHHLHAPLLKAALSAGRHVFMEKPLCLTPEELHQLDAVAGSGKGSVMVGFNRRFAPASIELKEQLRLSQGPWTASYRVFAGNLDAAHWYANYAESGGRVLGEACHFLDYFCYLFESKPIRVSAQPTSPAAGTRAFPDSIAA